MRNALLVTLAVCLAPLAALAGEEKPRPEPPGEAKGQEPEARIERALLTKKVTFDFVETPLADVANFLQGLIGENLILAPGLDKRAAVTLRVKDMTLDNALHWIARMVGGTVNLVHGALVIEPGPPGGHPGPEPPPGPRRPLGKATLSLGPGLTIEMELAENDLRPEARQLLLFLLHRQIVGEAQKHDPKAIQEFMEGMARQRQMEAHMRQRLEAQREAAMDAKEAEMRKREDAQRRAAMEAEARRRAEEEARRQREKPEGGEKKGRF